MSKLQVNDIAPNFTLPANNNKTISLEDLKGQNVVLYFYPKDDTPGCTVEAKDFRDKKDEFEKLNTVIIGASKDKITSHDKFIEKYDLNFDLVSDEKGENLLNPYGVFKEKSMFGKKYMGIERTTFLIDQDSKIVKIWNKVKVKGHVDEVLQAVKEL